MRTRPGFTRQAKSDQKSTWCPGFKEPRLIKSKKTHTFISTSESVSYKLQKENTSSEYLKGITRLTVPTNLNLIYHILFVRRGFKNSKFYNECIDSLALLQPKLFHFLKANISNITPKELTISASTKLSLACHLFEVT